MRWIVVCAAFLCAACGPAGPLAPLHTDLESQVYAEPMTRIVFTDLGSGDLTVRASSGPAATVARELHWRGEKRPRINEVWEGQTLRVSYECESPGCSVDYEVSLSATVEVHAETSSGDVDLRGLSGAVVVQTTSGDMSLSELSGDITVKATSGQVRTSELRSGQVTADTTSGDVTLDFAAAPKSVSVRATSGDTGITVPPGQPYEVHVRTTSGEQTVSIDQSQSAPARIEAESTSGDVRIVYGRARSGGTPSPS
jgi:DUF4097 and DUF4098 domain-containing protein YvlB